MKRPGTRFAVGRAPGLASRLEMLGTKRLATCKTNPVAAVFHYPEASGSAVSMIVNSATSANKTRCCNEAPLVASASSISSALTAKVTSSGAFDGSASSPAKRGIVAVPYQRAFYSPREVIKDGHRRASSFQFRANLAA